MKAILFLFQAGLALAGVDPMGLNAKVHAVYMSRSSYCTSLTQVFDTHYPEFMNFFIQPVLGTLDNSKNTYDGTYPCLVFKMSDTLYFRPGAHTNGCAFDTEYSNDLCQSGGTTKGVDGATTNCSNSEDTVFLYLSTASTSTTSGTGNPFTPPTSGDATPGIRLSSPLTISGANGGRFVINGVDKITSTGPGNCTLDFPAFSFVND